MGSHLAHVLLRRGDESLQLEQLARVIAAGEPALRRTTDAANLRLELLHRPLELGALLVGRGSGGCGCGRRGSGGPLLRSFMGVSY